jgi:tuftelin-interacting protein 11
LEDAIPPASTKPSGDSSAEEDVEEEQDDDEAMDVSDDEESTRRVPRQREEEEEEEEMPRGFGGMGGVKSFMNSFSGANSATGGIGSSKKVSDLAESSSALSGSGTPRGGIGSARPGIGSSSNPLVDSLRQEINSKLTPSPTPSRPSSFIQSTASPINKPTQKLNKDDKVHFSQLRKTQGVALAMMEKMGFKLGEGLGASGQGRATPIMNVVRPKDAGIGFDGFKEKGKYGDYEEEEKAETKKKVKKSDGEKAPWKEKSTGGKGKRKDKTKVEHRTYEEIVAEQGGAGTVEEGLGKIMDLTGAELPSLPSSLSFVPTHESTATHLPELRHNLHLLYTSTLSDLTSLAKEATSIASHRKFLTSFIAKSESKLQGERERERRLQEVMEIVERIGEKSGQGMLQVQGEAGLDRLEDEFDELRGRFEKEYQEMGLDEVVVGAITPIVSTLVLLRSAFVLKTCQILAEISLEDVVPCGTT